MTLPTLKDWDDLEQQPIPRDQWIPVRFIFFDQTTAIVEIETPRPHVKITVDGVTHLGKMLENKHHETPTYYEVSSFRLDAGIAHN